MRVIYDDKQEIIIVKFDDIEMTTSLNTTDIVDARDCFIERIANMFNEAICKKLKD